MSDTLNVAVWGLGPHALNNIVPAVHSCGFLRLQGVLSRNATTVENVCSTYDCQTWATTEDMLRDPILDAVYLATPTGLHYNQGVQILQHRKHLWCEKTLATNFVDTSDIIRESNRSGQSVCEGFMYLYHAQFKSLTTMLEKSELGSVRTIRSRFGLPHLSSPGFRTNRNLGGSCLLDVGSYPISAIQSIFSPKNIDILYASMTQNDELLDVEGCASLLLDDKIICHLEWAYDRSYINDMDVWGTHGCLYTDKIFSKKPNYRPKLQIRNVNGIIKTIQVEPQNHFVEMLAHFFKCSKDHATKIREQERIISLALLLNRLQEKCVR